MVNDYTIDELAFFLNEEAALVMKEAEMFGEGATKRSIMEKAKLLIACKNALPMVKP